MYIYADALATNLHALLNNSAQTAWIFGNIMRMRIIFFCYHKVLSVVLVC